MTNMDESTYMYNEHTKALICKANIYETRFV